MLQSRGIKLNGVGSGMDARLPTPTPGLHPSLLSEIQEAQNVLWFSSWAQTFTHTFPGEGAGGGESIGHDITCFKIQVNLHQFLLLKLSQYPLTWLEMPSGAMGAGWTAKPIVFGGDGQAGLLYTHEVASQTGQSSWTSVPTSLLSNVEIEVLRWHMQGLVSDRAQKGNQVTVPEPHSAQDTPDSTKNYEIFFFLISSLFWEEKIRISLWGLGILTDRIWDLAQGQIWNSSEASLFSGFCFLREERGRKRIFFLIIFSDF